MGRFIVFLLILCLALNGCILVPFINSAKQSGIMRGDRERLLQEELVKFHRVRFWGKPQQAFAFVTEDGRDRVQEFFRANRDEKVVESNVDLVNFEEDAYAASVAMRVKYYRIPFYIVEERIENQDWTFSVASGWKISDVQIDKKI